VHDGKNLILSGIIFDRTAGNGRRLSGQACPQKVPGLSSLRETGHDESDLIDLNRALDRLEEIDERKARMIELRVFLSFTADEILDISGEQFLHRDRGRRE
jgi:hypothetical protein